MSKIIGYNFGDPFISFSNVGIETSNTNITSLSSIYIPKDRYYVGDVLRVDSIFSKFNTNGGYDFRLYWNTTPDLNGSPIFFGFVSGTSTSERSTNLNRRLFITGDTNPTTVAISAFNNQSDYNLASPSMIGYNIDWSVDSYIVAAGRVTSNLDSVALNLINISNG
jgi:hypothetical protein